jgi:hypothetical protein
MKTSRVESGWCAAALVALAALAGAAACSAVNEGDDDDDGTGTDADGDTDADTDGDTDSDTDSDADGDTDTGTDAEAIVMDCSDCPGAGGTLQNMACAIDICDENAVLSQSYTTPCTFTGCTLEDTYEAVAHFGDAANDLAPRLGDSYALMASGIATGTSHTTACASGCSADDPWDPTYQTNDVVDWRLILKAPDEAKAFRFKYVFFSEEYDEWISSSYNDKFYAVLEAGSTNNGNPTVINFTACRDPDAYFDFICGPDDTACEEGGKYCYVAINTSLSECCWYDGCPDGTWTTDITGTGYSCAASQGNDSSNTGSSTGWLQTSWPIDGGETFAVTFHVHDTSDAILDSQVILDSFQFLKDPEQGTVPVE